MNKLILNIKGLFLIIFIPTYLAESNDVYYVAEFTDEIKDCDDFENIFFKCNGLTVGFIEGKADEESGLGLSGRLDILTDITEDDEISLNVWKETDFGKEFMYTIAGNICGSIGKKNAPWWPLVESLNATGCPIKQMAYPVNDLVLTLDFAKDVLRHEFVGDYQIELIIRDNLERQLSCHVVSVCVLEKTKE